MARQHPNQRFITMSPGNTSGTGALDDQPLPLVMTNVAFRGLPVPAGKHVVRMRYDPELLWLSAWISLVATLALALAAWFGDNRQAKASWTSKTN